MHPVHSTFDTVAGSSPIREVVLKTDRLRSIQTDIRPWKRNEINLKVSVFGTITLQVTIGDSRVRVVFDVVRNIAVPFLLGTSFIDKFVRGMFPAKQRVVSYHSKSLPIFAVNDKTEPRRDKNDGALDVLMTKEEQTIHLICVARQTKMSLKAEEFALVAIDAKELVQIEALLERNSTQAWKTYRNITSAILSLPLNPIILNSNNSSVCLVTNQQIATFLHLSTAMIHNECDEPLVYTLNTSLKDSVDLVYYQLHANRPQRMVSHKEVEKEWKMLTENWQKRNCDPGRFPGSQRGACLAKVRIWGHVGPAPRWRQQAEVPNWAEL